MRLNCKKNNKKDYEFSQDCHDDVRCISTSTSTNNNNKNTTFDLLP